MLAPAPTLTRSSKPFEDSCWDSQNRARAANRQRDTMRSFNHVRRQQAFCKCGHRGSWKIFWRPEEHQSILSDSVLLFRPTQRWHHNVKRELSCPCWKHVLYQQSVPTSHDAEAASQPVVLHLPGLVQKQKCSSSPPSCSRYNQQGHKQRDKTPLCGLLGGRPSEKRSSSIYPFQKKNTEI